MILARETESLAVARSLDFLTGVEFLAFLMAASLRTLPCLLICSLFAFSWHQAMCRSAAFWPNLRLQAGQVM